MWQKMRTTPMKDWIRGRFSGRYDWEWVVVSAAIPESCRGLVREVVGRLGLWRREKADVARELVAHFADGVEAGASAEELVERFGDVRQAARLIRRAKKRQRSVVYHARVLVGRVVGVTAALYVLLTGWMMVGEPQPLSIDELVARINAPIADVPVEERAWPILREIEISSRNPSLDLWSGMYPKSEDMLPEELEGDEDETVFLGDLTPEHPAWPRVGVFLERAESTIEKILAATEIEHLGFRVDFEYRLDEEDLRMLYGDSAKEGIGYEPEPDWSAMPTAKRLVRQSSIHVLLPHLGVLRRMSRLIQVEMVAAHYRGDTERVLTCVKAMQRIGDWARELPMMICCLVDINIKKEALERVGQFLRDDAEVYYRSELRALCHQLASMTFSVREGIESEQRFFMEEFLDRIYSKNGQLTDEGLECLLQFENYAYGRGGEEEDTAPTWGHKLFSDIVTSRWLYRLGTPIASMVLADRDAMQAMADRCYAETHAYGAMPYGKMYGYYSDLERLSDSTWMKFRYIPIFMFTPALSACYKNETQGRLAQDGLMIAMAAELYRRDQGVWPADQAEMVPRYLPKVYVDESDEALRPLILRVDDEGGLMIYGRGLDGDDDGGVRGERPWPQLDYNYDDEVMPDCDWVLYPVRQRHGLATGGAA
ncbi:hypothetical protein [Mucisphaera calidilacus]|uniref:hypothetical protein n=1 Tax=Mucisphaera calidilacus TaxID=2527982 RepID=UPI001F3906FF|nr:hypothetical protein [Mucisphaera calidilacus]